MYLYMYLSTLSGTLKVRQDIKGTLKYMYLRTLRSVTYTVRLVYMIRCGVSMFIKRFNTVNSG